MLTARRPILTLALTLGLAACSSGGDTTFAIADGDLALQTGERVTLSVQGASQADWSSSDASVATVSSAGQVEAVAPGSATVTAADPDDASVTDAVGVSVHTATTHRWTAQFGTGSDDVAVGVALGDGGEAVVTGRTSGDLVARAHAGSADAFARAFDEDGNATWSWQDGTALYDSAAGLALDGNGNAVVVGDTDGALGGSHTAGQDVFVVKLDGTGSEVWSAQVGAGSLDASFDVAVDGAGDVLVAGRTNGALEGANAGSTDAFVRKVDGSDGSELWTTQFGTGAGDAATGVAVDGDGDVLVAGYAAGVLGAMHAGGDDAFVRKLDGSDGSDIWTRQFGTSADDAARSVSANADGDVRVVGDTMGGLFGSGAGDTDAFVRAYDAQGNAVWGRQFGTAASDAALAVDLAGRDRAAIAGYSYGAVEGDNAGIADVFARELDGRGTELRTRQFGSSAFESGLAVATDDDGRLRIAGGTQGTVGASSAGGRDAFVRAYGAP